MIRFIRHFWNVAWKKDAFPDNFDDAVRRELDAAKRQSERSRQRLIRSAQISVDQSDHVASLLSATLQQLNGAGTDARPN
jgi:hypothetical protein